MSNRLSGRVCIITGTAGGMGREAARIFAREGALGVGCGLFADDAEATVAAVRAEGGTMVSLQPCDLTKPADCQALVNFAGKWRTSLCSWPPAHGDPELVQWHLSPR